MADVEKVLAEFDGFSVKYDPGVNPFFEAICVENLRTIMSKDLGVKLLGLIGSATPASRSDFPTGVNVRLMPLGNKLQFTSTGFKRLIEYSQSGTKIVKGLVASAEERYTRKKVKGKNLFGKVKVETCRFYTDGSSYNEALDRSGPTSVCNVKFTNAQMMTIKGQLSPPFIVLAHELIHSMHCLTGTGFGSNEEIATSGEGVYENEEFTEAAFRKLFNLPKRNAYH